MAKIVNVATMPEVIATRVEYSLSAAVILNS